MKFVKWLIISVAALLAIFVVATFFLPKEYHIERSVEIKAPSLLVFSNVVDLKEWQTWNPWNKMDPDMNIIFGQKKVGEGAFYSWTSEKVGNGTMTIIETNPPQSVKYKLEFEGYEDNPGYSEIILEAESATGPTTVTWTFEGDTGDQFFAPWMGIMMDKLLGPSYEEGLAALKEKCESQIQSVPGLPLP